MIGGWGFFSRSNQPSLDTGRTFKRLTRTSTSKPVGVDQPQGKRFAPMNVRLILIADFSSRLKAIWGGIVERLEYARSSEKDCSICGDPSGKDYYCSKKCRDADPEYWPII